MKKTLHILSLVLCLSLVLSAFGTTVFAAAAPTVPKLKSAVNIVGGVSVNWYAASGASGYYVYRRTGSGSWLYLSKLSGKNSTNYTDRSVKNGTTYTYTVRSYNYSQKSSLNSKGVNDLYITTPKLLSVSNQGNAIVLNWRAVSGTQSYTVYRKTAGTNWLVLASVTTASYTDTGAAENTAYTYTVRACRSGFRSSFVAAGLTYTFLKTPAFTKASLSANGAVIYWSAITGADRYRVYRRSSSGGWDVLGFTASGTDTSFKDTNVSSGNTYVYTVRAYQGNIRSDYDPNGFSCYFLGTPAHSCYDNKIGIIVQWSAVSGASGYTLYRKLDTDPSWSKLTTVVSGSTTSFTDTLAEGGKTYIYTVRAYKNSITGGYTPGNSIYHMGTPELVNAVIASDGTYIKFNSPAADSYRVYRRTNGGNWSLIGTPSGSVRYFVDKSAPSGTNNYTVRYVKNGVSSYYNEDGINPVKGTPIMGTAKLTALQMQAFLKANYPNVPQTILDMIPLYLSEGAAEGVRGDLAFAQSCLETGFFKFAGSSVTLDQNNFCGMGVTSDGMKGNSFDTPQLGIRAQIQHLKAYASKDALVNDRIDPRFFKVTRGCAPYLQWLGSTGNPFGSGWATGASYGEKIQNIMDRISRY